MRMLSFSYQREIRATMEDESQVTSSTQESAERPEERPENGALDLLSLGRARMICCDYLGASLAFDEACNLLAEKYGQVDDALGEPYHLYGRSLLELARQESSVLGSGVPVPGEESDSSEEEEEKEEKAEQEKAIEGGEKERATEEGGEKAEEPSSSCGDNDPPEAEVAGIATAVAGGDAAAPGDMPEVAADKGQVDEEDEPSTLQLAWEVLEVARVIYERQETHEGRVQLAEVCMTLGEVSLESDQYHRAIEDFTNCLKLREAVLEPSDRLLADAYYHLGLAFSLCNMVDEAIDEFGKSRDVLELRKEMLTNMVEVEGDEEKKERLREEITDLEQVLPDIIAKIIDSEESRRSEMDKKLSGNILEEDSPPAHDTVGDGDVPVNDISGLVRRKPADTSSGGCSSGDKPITDISHLVHRKRPAEENSVQNGKHVSKRPHVDERGEEEVVSSAQDS